MLLKFELFAFHLFRSLGSCTHSVAFWINVRRATAQRCMLTDVIDVKKYFFALSFGFVLVFLLRIWNISESEYEESQLIYQKTFQKNWIDSCYRHKRMLNQELIQKYNMGVNNNAKKKLKAFSTRLRIQ